MRRAAKWLGWIVAGIIGIPLLLIAFVFVAANTDVGQRAIESMTPQLTGDTVRIADLSGRFPDALRVGHVALRDPDGDYTTITGLALDWSPRELVHGRVVIDRLAAEDVDVMRVPGGQSSGGSIDLPVPVTLRALQVDRLDVGAAVAGTAAAVAVSGSGEANSLTDFHGALDIHQLGGSGRYTMEATSDANTIQATLHASEAARGMVAGITGLPDVGAIAFDGTVQGPRNALTTHVTLSAGPLHATAGGTVDLAHETADVMVSAQAPAMQPRPDVSWQSVSLDAHVHGAFTRPDATGRVQIDALRVAGGSVSGITADIAGNAGRVQVDGQVAELRLPVPNPDLLAGEPLIVQATATLDKPDLPMHVTLRHKLLAVDADAKLGRQRSVDATIKLADLTPYAAMDQVALQGALTLVLHAVMQGDTTTVNASGTVGVTGGMEQARSLVGDNGRLQLAATLRGNDVSLSQLEFTGQAMSLSAKGSVAANQVALDWSLGVNDLGAADPGLSGQFKATGRVSGATDNLSSTTDISGGGAAKGMSSGDLTAHIAIDGLPAKPRGQITAQGSLLDAPVDVAIAMRRQSDAVAIDIQRASWKSLQASGALEVPIATMVPAGNVHIAMTRLADLAPLVGQPIAGSVQAALDATADKLHLTLQVEGAAVARTASASRIALVADVDQPQSHPVLNARLDVAGIAASGVSGSLNATATGPAEAIGVKLSAALPDLQGAPGRVSAAATVNTVARTVNVASLQGDWHGLPVQLLAPVRVGFSDGVSIDRLRLGVRQAVLEVAGRVGTTLDLTASLRNLPAGIAATISPDYAFDGTITADARVTGTSARPAGKLHLAANGLRASSGAGRAVPAATITADATLNGADAQIDARVVAGSSRLTLNGRAPIAASGSLGLRAGGTLDLAMLDPFLTARGQRVHGKMELNATIDGRASAPAVAGTARLTGGDIQDYASGIHLGDVTARIEGSGQTIRIAQFSAKAGEGTITASGSVGVMAPGLPVDITVTARNAKPLASDLVSALLNADLTVRGEALGQLAVGGSVHVLQANIQIPERIPTSIAVLPVRMPGVKPPPPPSAPPSVIALDLTISAPEQIFVRGRGLNSEFGGTLKLGGTPTALRTQGAFDLRRGDINLAGTELTFTEGSIGFNGGSVTDPSLHLVATSSSASVTATLTIGGTASNPKVTLTSVPQLPQDEILAHLLFGTGTGSLGPLQVAGIAASLATLTGVGGGIGDPLSSVRQGLGLDRLSVGSGARGGPSVQAGRYVARGVYLGAQQSASGGGTQATIQVDIAKGLKLQGTAGTGSTSATGTGGTTGASSTGSSVGLTYQFEY
jgi:translocation and assembly module TamB